MGGKVQRLDAGLANGRMFLVTLGVGFDGEVVTRLHATRTGHISHFSYAKPIWQAMRSYRYPAIEVESCDDSTNGTPAMTHFRTSWLFAFNLPRYAANLPICPEACGDDGMLDLCSFARPGLIRAWYYFLCLRLGCHKRLTDFKHLRARSFRVTSTEPLPYQIDGDPGGTLPLTVEVVPQRITMMLPVDTTARR